VAEALEWEALERKALKAEALELETLDLEMLVAEALELEPETLELKAEALERKLETLEWRGARKLGRQKERQTHKQRGQQSVQTPALKSQTRPHDAPLSPAPRAPPIQADEGLTFPGVRPSS